MRRRTFSQRSKNVNHSRVVNASKLSPTTPSRAVSSASKAAVMASRSMMPLELILPKISEGTDTKRRSETSETQVTQVISARFDAHQVATDLKRRVPEAESLTRRCRFVLHNKIHDDPIHGRGLACAFVRRCWQC